MYPEPIEHYFAPTELTEVLTLLAHHPAGVKLLAGGQSLMPLMKSREIAASTLIDLNRVAGLADIQWEQDRIVIGALVRHSDVVKHARLQRSCTVLTEAAERIGDRQVRNRGTLAGSLVFADPTGDIAPAALALDARVIVAKADGSTRREAVETFITGSRSCHLARDELVTAIEIPLPDTRGGSSYIKHGRVAQDRAILGVAVSLTLGPNAVCERIRIAVCGIAPQPRRARALEETLVGKTLDAAALKAAGAFAAESIPTQSDPMASAAYRTQLLRVTVPETIAQAVHNAQQANS